MGVRGREETILNSTEKKKNLIYGTIFSLTFFYFETAEVWVGVKGREETILNSTEKKIIFNIWNYFPTNLFYFETAAVGVRVWICSGTAAARQKPMLNMRTIMIM